MTVIRYNRDNNTTGEDDVSLTINLDVFVDSTQSVAKIMQSTLIGQNKSKKNAVT
ncbi:hypothetical protein Q4489_04625 [Thalassotalea sp. 1_MG-2023]|uniref:hypothetical protein n=1 Tax=Thalassotalea sp. 1_MG-2023 TaxID=3062680 RepID=UPI0026E45E3F|nr:hypothetical protein [Thalassotalea sp. 1_MG-2023]MDO6426283.1 hypothetical protein [Thalassotalea sp. 1_MG-2023]